MNRLLALTAALLLAAPLPSQQAKSARQPDPAQPPQVTGIVLSVDLAHHTLLVSCDAIPDTMPAMDMPFTASDPRQLNALHPGASIRFTMLKRGHTLYAAHIEPTIAANLDSAPLQADSLSALQSALSPTSTPVLTPGQHVPDFTLTDQTGHLLRLSSLHGKVVLLTFGYSRCPNPDYCLRLANNLARVRTRLRARIPRDLVLITIAIDPEHDQGTALAEYAAVWHAAPPAWYFLTGPLPQIKSISAHFGMNFWRREGLLTHTLHTVILDRSGNLAANLEGNQFTPRQLGDLVQSTLHQPH